MKEYDEKFRGKNVLITGGLGFIGSNLARRLIELNPKKIAIIDSLEEGLGGDIQNVSDIYNFLDIYKINISDTEQVYRIMEEGVDYIFNLAGSIKHLDSKNRPLHDLSLNLGTHVAFLEACGRHSRKRKNRIKILYSSTRDVYGKMKERDLPIPEDAIVTEATDPQGIHKYATEFHHKWFGLNFNFDTVSLRLTNTYGPWQKTGADQGFLGYFIQKAINDEEIELWGGGKSLRDSNYIDDVVEAMLITMASEKAKGEVYNLGNFMRRDGKFEDVGEGIRTVGESAEVITKIAESGRCKIIPYPPERKDIEPGHAYLNATKIYEHIGWEPKVSFEEGIRRTINFYRNKN